jgi:uncharacterized protein
MNYLVTGASGFIGKHLVGHLLSQGHPVNYLARKRSLGLDSRAAFFSWNLPEPPPLDCMGRLDAVIHLAGEPVAQRWNTEVKRRIRDSRIQGTRALVDAIEKLKHKPSVLVSASAIGYYGDRGDTVLTEEAQPGTGFLANLCVAWECEAMRAVQSRLRVVPVRISVVLGADGGALPKMVQAFRLGLGGTLGDGKQWMSWIHVDDLVNLLQFAAENPAVAGPLNGATPTPVTNREFTSELAALLHRPALFRIPRFVLRASMGELGPEIIKSLRTIPEAAERRGFRFRFADLSDAIRNSLNRPA